MVSFKMWYHFNRCKPLNNSPYVSHRILCSLSFHCECENMTLTGDKGWNFAFITTSYCFCYSEILWIISLLCFNPLTSFIRSSNFFCVWSLVMEKLSVTSQNVDILWRFCVRAHLCNKQSCFCVAGNVWHCMRVCVLLPNAMSMMSSC